MNIGLPALFLVIRLLLHAFAPRTSPQAGGYLIFVILAAGFLPTFGFISAVMLGGTAGSRDLAEGMFRHLVVTGRSRLALYLARIPAGLAILAPLLAISYLVIGAVSVFAAPAFVTDWNLNVPPGLSNTGLRTGQGTAPCRSSARSTTDACPRAPLAQGHPGGRSRRSPRPSPPVLRWRR